MHVEFKKRFLKVIKDKYINVVGYINETISLPKELNNKIINCYPQEEVFINIFNDDNIKDKEQSIINETELHLRELIELSYIDKFKVFTSDIEELWYMFPRVADIPMVKMGLIVDGIFTEAQIQEIFNGDLSNDDANKYKSQLPKITTSKLHDCGGYQYMIDDVVKLNGIYYIVVE